MLLARFPVFQRMVTVRRRYAALYHRKFAGIPGIIRLPEDRPHEKSVYYTYTVRVKRRDGLKAYLERKGIETKVQHPYLMPDQPVYKGYPRDRLTRARAIVGEILCIPAHEKLSLDDIDTVAVSIRDFYAETDTRE
jgi:dTDP-4-amino-4,6-dideoxygalactose transaminase